MSNNVFTPVVDAEKVYGEGDWRPLLGDKQRKNNWRLYMIGKQSIDHRLKGVILPSYDFTLSLDDKSFPTSVGACWTTTPDERVGRHFVPNAFALPILMYPFLGEKKEHWLSPFNRRNMIGNDTLDAEEYADAFDDLNKWVRRNKTMAESTKDMLLKTQSMKEEAPIPGRTVRYFSLVECVEKESPEWHPAVIGYTSSAYSYLLEQMRWHHQDDTEPRDPNWPRYMLGDPTDPNNAMVFHCDKVAIDAKDTYETNVLCFTKRREYLDDPVETHKVSEGTLAKRFLLPDPSNWNIPTYEEQVMHMIEHFDSRVTIDMIQAACGYRFRGNMPSERPKHVTYSDPGTTPAKAPEAAEVSTADTTAAVTEGGNAAPKAGLAPTSKAPVIPGAAPEIPVVKDATTYWAGLPSGTPTKMTKEELQAAYASGAATGFKVNVNDAWLNIEDSGLVTVAVTEAVPVIPDAAPPSVPADESSSDGITKEELRSRIFNNDLGVYDALEPDAKAKVDKLIDEAHAAGGDELPQHIVDSLLVLIS